MRLLESSENSSQEECVEETRLLSFVKFSSSVCVCSPLTRSHRETALVCSAPCCCLVNRPRPPSPPAWLLSCLSSSGSYRRPRTSAPGPTHTKNSQPWQTQKFSPEETDVLLTLTKNGTISITRASSSCGFVMGFSIASCAPGKKHTLWVNSKLTHLSLHPVAHIFTSIKIKIKPLSFKSNLVTDLLPLRDEKHEEDDHLLEDHNEDV